MIRSPRTEPATTAPAGRRRRRAAPLLVALGAAAGVAAPVVGARPGAGAQVAGTALIAEAQGRLSSSLLGTPLDGADYAAAVGALRGAEAGLERALATGASAAARRDQRAAEEADLRAHLEQASAEERAAAEALDAARRRLERVAVAAYVTGAATAQVSALLDATTATDLQRRSHLIDVVRDDQRAVADGFVRARDAASDDVARTTAALDSARRDRERAQATLDAAVATTARLRAELPGRRSATAAAAPGARVAGTDLPLVAVDAYLKAAASSGSCGIPWTAVAGVGRVESFHGTYGGRRPAGDGDISPPIIGIPLDGTRSTRRILDTDAGALDGDALLDRAVGPTQFLPTTWATFGSDGNGDGVADPQNLYDAARATARYLCRGATGPMRADDVLRAAFFRYNRSDAYATSVLDWTHRYDAVRLGGA